MRRGRRCAQRPSRRGASRGRDGGRRAGHPTRCPRSPPPEAPSAGASSRTRRSPRGLRDPGPHRGALRLLLDPVDQARRGHHLFGPELPEERHRRLGVLGQPGADLGLSQGPWRAAPREPARSSRGPRGPCPRRISGAFVNCTSSYPTTSTLLPHGSRIRLPLTSAPASRAASSAPCLSSTTRPKWRWSSGACLRPSESARNWSPRSTNAIRPARPRSESSKMRP